MQQKLLTVELSQDGTFWGRLLYDDDLIVDAAKSVGALQTKFKKALRDLHDVDPANLQLEVAYDLASFFEETNFLKISAIADRAGINANLMQQYVSGNKFASEDRVKQIESVLHDLGKQLQKIRLVKSAQSDKPATPARKKRAVTRAAARKKQTA